MEMKKLRFPSVKILRDGKEYHAAEEV